MGLFAIKKRGPKRIFCVILGWDSVKANTASKYLFWCFSLSQIGDSSQYLLFVTAEAQKKVLRITFLFLECAVAEGAKSLIIDLGTLSN